MNGPRRPRPSVVRARVRITAITLACLTVVLCAGGAAVLGIYRRDLIGQLDDRLTASAAQVGLGVGSGPAVAGEELNIGVQAVDAAGRVTFAGVPLQGVPALWSPGDPTRPHTVGVTGGRYRVTATPLNDVWVVFAQPLDSIDGSVHTLRTTMLIALPALLAGLGLIVWLAVGRALRPVVVAVERERRLVTDASHELRSPIAGLRVLLETEPDSDAAIAEDRRRALRAVHRLEILTDQLLQLGRAEVAAPTDRRPVDLDDLVRRVVGRADGTGGRTFDLSDVVAGQVTGSEADLERVVDNLVSNAVRHASQRVKIAVSERDGRAVLAVDDDGPGIAAADRVRVFERFTRLDSSRTRASGGAGLGLSIVRATVEAHAGTVAIEDSPLGGCRVVAVFPATTRA